MSDTRFGTLAVKEITVGNTTTLRGDFTPKNGQTIPDVTADFKTQPNGLTHWMETHTGPGKGGITLGVEATTQGDGSIQITNIRTRQAGIIDGKTGRPAIDTKTGEPMRYRLAGSDTALREQLKIA